ncbi:four-carbon acid sugar kinase family protein [Paracoccus gahaiensis]|uniref:Four-carbon acid sugar kinase family protein n=2 Tax=Paracoccus gahaiensis TaxID=1706839 RepID=A0A4U0R866_9RHOB|nr:four-carbon acid sugar kinase family protein [Paracoccus gahaiensis]
MGRPRLCIIADDLTGALDAAAPFATRGLSVHVATHPAALDPTSGADILAVSTNSRDGTQNAARDAVAQVLSRLPVGVLLFKKVDSRLKGHVAVELDALWSGPVLVAPAIPEFGRVTQSGHVTGFGVEIPISIADILGPLAHRAEIPDTLTTQDMRRAADALPDTTLPVGARALAEALAARMTDDVAPLPWQPPRGPVLILVGSRDPITLDQVAAVARQGAAHVIEAPSGHLPPLPDDAPGPVLVVARPGGVPASGDEVADRLAHGAHPALTAERPVLVLTGGATAQAMLARLGVDRLTLIGECLPGLPVAQAGGFTVIAKSGGFGDTRTLVTLLAKFVGES